MYTNVCMIIFGVFTLQENLNKTYDRLFRKENGYNNKLHRDDREHAKSRGLTVNNEVGFFRQCKNLIKV